MKSIILAGGSGTRLWPLSREKYPKQFLKFGKRSLFQNTVERCIEISNIKDILVITNEAQKFLVIGQIKELELSIPEENVLVEPKGKNTLPAICFGIKEIEKKNGKSTVGIFPSDHILSKNTMKTIADAEILASEYLVTFGIVPTCPHTGYGYINISDSIRGNIDGYKVSDFREKPDIEDAKRFIEEGCLWNSGMFLFDTSVFFEELKNHQPEIFKLFKESDNIGDIFGNVTNISIDYGVMEKSGRVAVVKLNDNWSDLGNFDAIYNVFDKDDSGNVAYDCDKVLVNSKNNLIFSRPKKVVSLIDTNNMIIVDTTDALLVCPRSSSQDVKQVVTDLKNKNDVRAYLHETVYKPWGSYTLLESSDMHKIKNITVMPGKKLSLQLHYHRNEHWAVVKGTAIVQVDDNEFFLRKGESTFIKEGMKHRLSNPGRIPLEIIEIQLGDVVDEDDIIRFEDDYGRIEEKKKN